MEGCECSLSFRKFKVLQNQVKSDFPIWKRLENGCGFHADGQWIGNDYFSKEPTVSLFSIRKNSGLEGKIPVVIYFIKNRKLLFFLADDGIF